MSHLGRFLALLILAFLATGPLALAQEEDDLTSLFTDDNQDIDPTQPQVAPPAPPLSPATPVKPQLPIKEAEEIPAQVTQENNSQPPTTGPPVSESADADVRNEVPPPPWLKEDLNNTGSWVSGTPIPDFDSSQSRWQQLEIGQFNQLKDNSATPQSPATSSPPAVTNEPTTTQATTTVNPTLAPRAPETSERTQLKQLFSDMIPDTPPAAPEPDLPPAPSLTVPLSPPTQPDSKTDTPAPVQPPATTMTVPLSPPQDTSPDIASETRPAITPVASPEETPVSTTDPQETPASKTAPVIMESPSLGRAGSLLLDLDDEDRAGSATILDQEPLAVKPGNTKTTKTRPPEKKTPVAPSSEKKAPRSQSQRPAVRPNLSLILVNETGRPQVGEDYRIVLSQMGYRIISVTEGPAQPGQTIITYQSGHKGQATSLARHLPGSRILEQARETIPAEAIVTIR